MRYAMSNGNSLINLGALSKPATVLFEKIADAIGGLYRPHQIKRIAKAEAEAAIIEAKTEIEITDLTRRAMQRWVDEETKKQENMESIASQAVPLLENAARPQDMDNDWIANFFDKCRLVSDKEMQALWARVLAGEANAPGEFSKRTISFMQTMDKQDATRFQRLCALEWTVNGERIPLFFNSDNMETHLGVFFEELMHLSNIGLVTLSMSSPFHERKLPKTIEATYFGRRVTIELFDETDNELSVGNLLYTEIGKQLASVCQPRARPGMLEYTVEEWTKSLPPPKNISIIAAT
jgi:hypothetical protein